MSRPCPGRGSADGRARLRARPPAAWPRTRGNAADRPSRRPSSPRRRGTPRYSSGSRASAASLSSSVHLSRRRGEDLGHRQRLGERVGDPAHVALGGLPGQVRRSRRTAQRVQVHVSARRSPGMPGTGPGPAGETRPGPPLRVDLPAAPRVAVAGNVRAIAAYGRRAELGRALGPHRRRPGQLRRRRVPGPGAACLVSYAATCPAMNADGPRRARASADRRAAGMPTSVPSIEIATFFSDPYCSAGSRGIASGVSAAARARMSARSGPAPR